MYPSARGRWPTSTQRPVDHQQIVIASGECPVVCSRAPTATSNSISASRACRALESVTDSGTLGSGLAKLAAYGPAEVTMSSACGATVNSPRLVSALRKCAPASQQHTTPAA